MHSEKLGTALKIALSNIETAPLCKLGEALLAAQLWKCDHYAARGCTKLETKAKQMALVITVSRTVGPIEENSLHFSRRNCPGNSSQKTNLCDPNTCSAFTAPQASCMQN